MVQESLGITVAQVCRKGDLTDTTYYRVRAGTARVGRAVSRQVADALGCAVSDLFDRSGWPLMETP